MKKLIYLYLLIGFVGFVACSDDEDQHQDETQYSVTIHSPNTEAKHVGNSIHIHVDFDEANEGTVHHINVTIKSKVDGEVIYSAPSEAHVHETSGHFEHHDDFVLNVDEHTDWILKASVWGHEEGLAETSESIEFHVHP